MYPWNITVLQDVPTKSLTLKIRGIPNSAPTVGDTYDLYVLVQDVSLTDSIMTDAIKVTWTIGNGPSATIKVSDMYTTSKEAILRDFTVDTLNQDWKVSQNLNEAFTCYKVNS